MKVTTNQLEKMLQIRKSYAFKRKKEMTLLIDPHAFKRWGERVAKTPGIITELENMINQLYIHGRIDIQEDIGKIDGDVVFTYKEINEEELLITTFYGRISNQPALIDLRYLRRYNETQNERLNLNLMEKELQEQAPIIPAEKIVKAKINKKKYIVETFQTEDKGVVYVLSVNYESKISSILLETWDVANYPVLQEKKMQRLLQ